MKNKKIRDVLRFFERYLTPQEALWLVQDCLNITHESICLHMEKEIPEEYTQKIDLLSHEVKRGKPFSYLIGNHFFMGEQFFVSPDTLIPRPETETLIIEAYKHLSPKKKEQKILELGTGSGIISIVLKKKLPQHLIYATDQSPQALLIARQNALYHNVFIHFSEGHWYDAIGSQQFDCIIANPPYMAPDDPYLPSLQHEPRSALVAEKNGYSAIEDILKKGPLHLNTGGVLFLEHGWQQGFACQKKFHHAQFTAIQTIKDKNFCDRVTYGTYGGKSKTNNVRTLDKHT